MEQILDLMMPKASCEFNRASLFGRPDSAVQAEEVFQALMAGNRSLRDWQFWNGWPGEIFGLSKRDSSD
jgi:hypothetical protein